MALDASLVDRPWARGLLLLPPAAGAVASLVVGFDVLAILALTLTSPVAPRPAGAGLGWLPWLLSAGAFALTAVALGTSRRWLLALSATLAGVELAAAVAVRDLAQRRLAPLAGSEHLSSAFDELAVATLGVSVAVVVGHVCTALVAGAGAPRWLAVAWLAAPAAVVGLVLATLEVQRVAWGAVFLEPVALSSWVSHGAIGGVAVAMAVATALAGPGR